jgi:hypothetical protein
MPSEKCVDGVPGGWLAKSSECRYLEKKIFVRATLVVIGNSPNKVLRNSIRSSKDVTEFKLLQDWIRRPRGVAAFDPTLKDALALESKFPVDIEDRLSRARLTA